MNLAGDIAGLLGSAALARFREKLIKRLISGRPLAGVLHISGLRPDECDALSRVLGRTVKGQSATVRLDELDAYIRQAGISGGLEAIVRQLGGAQIGSAQDRAAREHQWEGLWASLAARNAIEAAWLADLRQTGLLRRLAGNDPEAGRGLLARAWRVASILPAGGRALTEIAASELGDSHALDAGMPLHTLTVRLAARHASEAAWTKAEDRRRAWAGAGVRCDELSAPVLVLNLRAHGETGLARALALHAELGEPYRVSIRQLLREAVRFSSDSVGPSVFVCENPSVVAAAAEKLGGRCAPLVCTEGQPATAFHLLTKALRAAGIELRYHGDFDWGGVRIANEVYRRYGFQPWRYDAQAYQDAPPGRPLRGRSAEALWDPKLGAAMQARRTVVHEEAVLPALLEDLRGGS